MTEHLNKNGDLIGTKFEHKLRAKWRKIAIHHGLTNDGVVEADIVQAFLQILKDDAKAMTPGQIVTIKSNGESVPPRYDALHNYTLIRKDVE